MFSTHPVPVPIHSIKRSSQKENSFESTLIIVIHNPRVVELVSFTCYLLAIIPTTPLNDAQQVGFFFGD